MGDGGDRMDRAGRYVLGLMDDDERERAERDLEIDPAFRDAMMVIAERMHVFDACAGQPMTNPLARRRRTAGGRSRNASTRCRRCRRRGRLSRSRPNRR